MGSQDGTKPLYGAVNNAGYVNGFLVLATMHDEMPDKVKEAVEGRLSESTLDALEWARDFMNKYEKRKKWKNG